MSFTRSTVDANALRNISLALKNVKNRTANIVQKSTSTVYVCRGALAFKSAAFVDQAKAASAVLSGVLINGRPLVVEWSKIVHVDTLTYDWIHRSNYVQVYNRNKRAISEALDPNNEYCIIGIEIDEPLGEPDIIGLASTCGACDSFYNDHLFMVSYSTYDGTAFATILHEIMHLFCALHTKIGVMRPIITPDSNLAYISTEARNIMAAAMGHENSCVVASTEYTEYEAPKDRDTASDETDPSMIAALTVSGASVLVLMVAVV